MLSPAAATRHNSLISGSLLGRRLEIVTAPPAEPAANRRLRIYELNSNLHCSIVGTCLSTRDLRQLLGKLNIAAIPALSEHDLHKHGVTLASQRDASGKLLHKTLDHRHNSPSTSSPRQRPKRRSRPSGPRQCSAARSPAPIGRC